MNIDSDVVTVKEAARILGYSERNVYELLREGVLPGKKYANRWFINRFDVDALKEKQTDKGRLPKGVKNARET